MNARMPTLNIKWFTCNLAIVLVAFSWLVAPPQLSAATTCLQFEGILDYTRAPVRDPVHPLEERKESYLFKVTTQERMWNIRMIPVEADKSAIIVSEIGCDGEMLYVYKEQNLELYHPKDTNGLPVSPLNSGVAMIIPDNVPNPTHNRCEALWLAFCSSWYFQTNTLQQARQLWLSRAVTWDAVFTNILVKASWQLLPENNQYLANIDYYPTSRNPQDQVYPLVTYRTLRTKEVESVTVPMEFNYIRFNERNRKEKIPFETYFCQVTNVQSIPPLEDFKPKISVPVMMSDYRFSTDKMGVHELRQLITNGVWQEKHEALSSKQYKTQKRVALQVAKQPISRPRKYVIGFLIANALIFGYVMIKNRHNKTKTKS